jgi:hypothetical protein
LSRTEGAEDAEGARAFVGGEAPGSNRPSGELASAAAVIMNRISARSARIVCHGIAIGAP